ncbi:hypothetical protein V7157_25545 [Neobacillus drentensis]|uniref:hypothetical protein n=1 Tax=Neobacillus drentensis TaxID=220684 RepID=UPI003001F75B
MKQQLGPYFGLTQLSIYEKITGKIITDNIPKNLGKMISDILIGKDDELAEKHDLFSKTTYTIKNIPVDQSYNPLERLTFRNIVFSEFDTPWEDSVWKDYFEEVSFIFICYEGKGKKNGYRVLKDVKLVSFTDEDIELLGKSYEMIRDAVREKDISRLPYPGSFEGQVHEIAPRGKGGDRTYQAFFEKDVTKTCFMLRKDFVKRKLQDKS